MRDTNDLIKTIKQMVLETVDSTKPCNYVFGEVTSTSPLEINVEQKFVLSQEMLILTRGVTEYTLKVSMEWEDEETLADINVKQYVGEETHAHEIEDNKHTHKIEGEKEITIHAGLEVGEKVILLRQQGGQKYLVLDRVVVDDT